MLLCICRTSLERNPAVVIQPQCCPVCLHCSQSFDNAKAFSELLLLSLSSVTWLTIISYSAADLEWVRGRVKQRIGKKPKNKIAKKSILCTVHLTLKVCAIRSLLFVVAIQANMSVKIVAPLIYAQVSHWTHLLQNMHRSSTLQFDHISSIELFIHTGMGSRGAAHRFGPQRCSIECHRCYWGPNKRSLGLGGHPVCPCGS